MVFKVNFKFSQKRIPVFNFKRLNTPKYIYSTLAVLIPEPHVQLLSFPLSTCHFPTNFTSKFSTGCLYCNPNIP